MEVRIDNGFIASAEPARAPRLEIDGERIELPSDAVMLPGLVDTHCHLTGPGMMHERLGLFDATSAAECLRRVADVVRHVEPGGWLLGNGWNQEAWTDTRRPDRHMLDRVAADVPVVLYRIDTHAAWLNSAALERASITPRSIAGGAVEVDGAGEPTGILVDNAIALLEHVLPRQTDADVRRWLGYTLDQCVRHGLTEVHDMNVEPSRLDVMAAMSDRGQMPIRTQLFLQAQNDEWRHVGAPGSIATNVDVVGVKYFADGALGSRGALLLEPYADDATNRGIDLMGTDELVERAAPAIERGFVVATHAIGDAACRAVLDAYQRLRSIYPEAVLRIEHAQNVHPDDLPRFAELGVIAAMQPGHCTSDAAMAEARLGTDRCRNAYPWRSLLDRRTTIIGGSDFPIEPIDPQPGLRAFVDRRPAGGEPWHPEQSVDRSAALAAYTSNAPLGIAAAGSIRRGQLRAGYDADLVVLAGDPFEGDGCQTLLTVVRGHVRWSNF